MTASGLKAIFLAERAMLLRLLTARLRDPEAAADVLQDLWLRLESVGSGPVADPSAYLFRMANNLAFDRRRSETRRSGRDGAWLEAQASDADYPTAEDALIARQMLAALEAALEALPERTRRIFRAYRFNTRSRREIADEEGISVSAVEKHLHRAYKAIAVVRASRDVEDNRG